MVHPSDEQSNRLWGCYEGWNGLQLKENSAVGWDWHKADGERPVIGILRYWRNKSQSNLSINAFRSCPLRTCYLNFTEDMSRNQIKIGRTVFLYLPFIWAAQPGIDVSKRTVKPFAPSDTLHALNTAINHVVNPFGGICTGWIGFKKNP